MTNSTIQATVDVVATTQVHGGTRVITLAATTVNNWHVVRLTAYDSNHPGDDHLTGVYSGPDRDELIAQARETAVDSLRPSAPGEPCGCWAGWDPWCGAVSCWGDYRHPLAALTAAAS